MMVVASYGCAKVTGTSPGLPAVQQKAMNNTKSFVVAGGCFWCVEAIYEELKGVISVESGYAGGKIENPTYSQVCSGLTGHAEAVKVTFDPAVVSESDLLHLFFTTHDPTTLNKQGGDVGTQYRSAIFYKDEAEKSLAESVIKEIERDKIWSKPIVTTLEPLTTFYPAEDYHQDYFKKFEKATPEERLNMNAGYCSAVIEPKVAKFRTKYRDKLKK